MAAGDIKVYHGTKTLTSGGTSTHTLSTSVGALNKAFVMVCNVVGASMGPTSTEDDPRDFTVTVDLTATDTITFTRDSSATGTIDVQWMIWEYVGAASGANEFKVHRPASSLYAPDNDAYDAENVTLDDGFLPALQIPAGVSSDETGNNGSSFLCLHNGADNPGGVTSFPAHLSRRADNDDGAVTQTAQVVEWKGSNWNLYAETGNFANTTTGNLYDSSSYSYADVDWTECLIFSSKRVDRDELGGGGGWQDDVDDANDLGWVVLPKSSGSYDYVEVNVDNAVYSSTEHEISIFVLENTAGFMTVEHIDSVDGGESNLAASTTNDYTVTAVNSDYGGALATAWTDSTASDLRPALYNWHLTSSTNLRLERETSTGTGEFAAQVFQFDAPPTIDLSLHSSSTTHHTMSVAAPPIPPVLGLHESTTTIHGLALPSATAHRDTRYYASGTIATDLGQYETDLTASGVGGYETSSARANITGERNVYYRGDLSTADTNTVLVRHGDTTTVTTNTYGLAVGGTDGIQVLYGSTALIDMDVGMSGTDQDFSIGWSTRANPLTTGASDAQVSELWVYNHDTGDRYFEQATHAAPSGSDGYAFSVAGWWDGATMQGSPANAPSDVRIGTTYYPAVQYDDEFVSATPYATNYGERAPKAPVWKASGAASEGEWLGWQAQYAAHAANKADLRLASPIVNAVYRDAETLSWDGSGLYEPEKRHQYAPGGQTAYQMATSYLWWGKLPLTYSRVRVRVCVSSYPTSGADVPLGLTCYSMDRPPPWPCNWKRTAPVVATYSHTTAADREWVDLGELELVRLTTPEPAYNHTTHLALGYAIDPASATAIPTAARIVIHAWQVVPVISTATNGPEQGLQPAPPTTPLQPFQLLSGG